MAKRTLLKVIAWVILFLWVESLFAQQGNTPNDGDWTKKTLTLTNTPEADVMIRVGDIDNLNFGFPEDFNPFCGVPTQVHPYPWEADPSDPKGTDKIMIGKSFKAGNSPCDEDGYSGSAQVAEPITLPTTTLKATTINNAALIIFIDDFQAPVFCSSFQVTLNGVRFPEAEQLINAIEQTGPIGKLIIIPLTDNLLPLLKSDNLALKIDDVQSKAGDGFAIDFVKLVVNYKPTFTCIGDVVGVVKDEETEAPIANANVQIYGFGNVTTNAKGEFSITKLPATTHIVTGSVTGYESKSVSAEVMESQQINVEIKLKKSGKSATFEGKTVKEGESIIFNKIQFEQGSAVLSEVAKAELTKIVAFLQQNPKATIQLSGHTSSEGDRNGNVKLSFNRVNSCRDFIVSKGIEIGRITAVGFGPDKPIETNATEEGRKTNRRVEMQVLKL
jgi:OmpA-OmpF porin, OOP family